MPGTVAGTLLVVSIVLCDDGVRVNTPDHTRRTAGQHTRSPFTVCVCVCVYVTAGSRREQESEPPPSRLTAGWVFEEFIMKLCLRLAGEL